MKLFFTILATLLIIIVGIICFAFYIKFLDNRYEKKIIPIKITFDTLNTIQVNIDSIERVDTVGWDTIHQTYSSPFNDIPFPPDTIYMSKKPHIKKPYFTRYDYAYPFKST